MADAKKADYRALLNDALKALNDVQAKLSLSEGSKSEPIAIVGMGCRLPGGSDTPEQFWTHLSKGSDLVTEIPARRWDVDEFYDTDPDAPGRMYCRYGAFIGDVQRFDSLFFGISPREAVLMDPQQRLLLETTWEALENAGMAPDKLVGSRTGVFVGMSTNDYYEIVARAVGTGGNAYAGTGNTDSVAAGRISYCLGLNGPCMCVDTACSSSLVTLHLACQSLRNRECDAALSGGVNLMLTPTVTINFCKGRMLSPDGSCKTFDAAANGYVRAEGVGMLVLKRLSDAMAARDRVIALIRGSAVNQDGRSSGLTVPSGPAQQAVIREALAAAALSPGDVDYLEAHGTGTALGDPIELEALGHVFAKSRDGRDPLWVGSAKTNVGHLEAAAGVTGVLKTVLSLQNQVIPPHLHLRNPTKHVDWNAVKLRVPTKAVPWTSDGKRARVAGVSSFGFSGTNAHIIVAEAPAAEERKAKWERPRHMLALSARSPEALKAMLGDYQNHLQKNPGLSFADICFTAGVGRSRFAHRLALHAANTAEAVETLSRLRSGQTVRGTVRHDFEGKKPARTAFLFTGQGSQYVGMGRQLYETQPVFRRTLDKCSEMLQPHLPKPLLSVLYPEAGSASPLDETAFTQPAIFAIEYAMAKMWRSWGVKPTWTLGHSIGEYVAACISGVYSLEDGLKLIAVRGRLMQELPKGGAMVALVSDSAKVMAAIAGKERHISPAGFNGPRQIVLSGDEDALQSVVARLEEQGARAHWLTVSHAFHSHRMEPMLKEYAKTCAEVKYSKPRITIISSVTGKRAGNEICTPEYWTRQVREPVQFATAISSLVNDGARILLEVGAKPTLTGLGQQCVDVADAVWLPSLREGRSNWHQVLECLGTLFVRGVPVDFESFDKAYARRKVALPTYPFQRQRLWADMAEGAGAAVTAALDERSLAKLARDLAASDKFSDDEKQLLPKVLMTLAEGRKAQPGETKPAEQTQYEITWEPRALPPADEITPPPKEAHDAWVILADASGVAASVARLMEVRGHRCHVSPLPAKTKAEDAASSVDFAAILATATDSGKIPLGGVIHCWNLNTPGGDQATWQSMSQSRDVGCGSALRVAQALLERSATAGSARLWVVTRGAQAIAASAGEINPAQSPVWGLGRVVGLEHPEIWGGLVDIQSGDEEELFQLVRQVDAGDGEDQIALRGARRYVPRLTPVEQESGATLPPMHGDATYLVVGGLGGLGLATANWLVAHGARHLVLTSRRGAATEEAKEAVAGLEQAGAEVRVVAADVADHETMAGLFAELATGKFTLKGVFHAAGVSAVAAVEKMTVSELNSVLDSKVLGAWNLDRQSRNLPLDYFVMFSSIASVWGSAGQSHYAAANHYLDILAHQRRTAGVAATTVNWGPWAGSGMATAEARGWLAQLGITAWKSDQALGELEACLSSGTVQRTVVRVDWNRFKAVYEARARRPFLERISAAWDTETELSDEVRKLQALSSAEQRKRMFAIVQEEVAAVLGFTTPEEANPRLGFFDMGMNSLTSVEMQQRLAKRLGWRPPATLAFDYPTVEKLAQFLSEKILGASVRSSGTAQPDTGATQDWSEPIAVVGMAGRFPGAGGDLLRFGELLAAGTDLISEVPPERWNIDEFYDPDPEKAGKMYCRYGSFLKDIELFDSRFFHITPREALNMDPQQRMMLEACWEAFENAGYAPAQLRGSRTGVFIGVTSTEYARVLAASWTPEDLDPYFLSGNALNAIAGRVSFAFDLTGPSATMDTACSSSLSSVHAACQSLRAGEVHAALAGGVNLTLLPEATLATCRTRMLSADGSCKTFDAAADGYVRGEGMGIVMLKRLKDAQADGDRILAVILGSAVNQDGGGSGLTVPNGVAQQTLIRQALANARLQPADIDYVEAHGSGTALGDPIELGALGAVFADDRGDANPLLVGAVKTNVGHLEAAAGIAGLIKVVLALRMERIPPHLHFRQPTPHANWHELNIRVPTESVPWPRAERRRIAGVSSFGFSGTNAHVIVADPLETTRTQSQWRRPRHLLPLSATTAAALDAMVATFAEHLAAHPDLDLAEVCHTAGVGRNHFSHRLALQADTTAAASGQLRRLADGESVDGVFRAETSDADTADVAFVFTGQGSQYVGMGRLLYETQPVFHEAMDHCDEILRAYMDKPLVSLLYSDAAAGASDIHQTGYAQPAIFALQYALAETWKSWGIKPTWVMGHSVGEYAAACVAGVFSLEDGLKLIAARGRLMQKLPTGGAMVALLTDAEPVLAAIAGLESKVSVAAFNGPQQVVLSGDKDALEGIVSKFKAGGVAARWLKVSHAFHSPRMDPMTDEFGEICSEVNYTRPAAGMISNVSGQVAGDEVCTPEYWREHVRQPVAFVGGVETLLEQGAERFLEIGPKPVLIGMAQQFVNKPGALWLSSLADPRRKATDWQEMLTSLGTLYAHGATVDFQEFDRQYALHKAELPSYRFQRQRHWPEAKRGSLAMTATGATGVGEHPVLGHRLALPKSKEVRFETVMMSNWPHFLDDHRLFGSVVCPGASHIASMLSAGDKMFGAKGYVLSDVFFPQALVLQDGMRLNYQLAFVPEEKGGYFAQAMSYQDEEAPAADVWATHATGHLRRAEDGEKASGSPSVDIDGFRKTSKRETKGSEFYDIFWKGGYTLGESFRWIDHIWSGEAEGICRLRLPEVSEKLDDYVLHPGLLDSCFQALAAFGAHSTLGVAAAGSTMRIPFHVGRIQVFRRPGRDTLWMYGRLEKGKDGSDIVSYIELFTESGELIARVEGFVSKPVSRAALLAALQEDTSKWLYDVRWDEVAMAQLPAARLEQPDEPDRVSWLVLADAVGVAEGLIGRLRERGDICIRVSMDGGEVEKCEDSYQVDARRKEDFEKLLDEVLREDAPPCRGVVCLWNVGASTVEDAAWQTLEEELQLHCGGLVSLLQAWITRTDVPPPRWYVATCGAQPVEASDKVISLTGASLWGMTQVMALEHPELRCTRVDLDPDEQDMTSHVDALLAEILVEKPNEDQMAYRRGKRFVPRLVRHRHGTGSGPILVPESGAFRLQLSEFGLLDGLSYRPLVRRPPREGEVEIEIVTAGLNFRDVLRALGMLQEYERAVGVITAADALFGLECGGRVAAVGEHVTDFKIGDEVVGLFPGTLASHVVAPSRYFVHKPKSLPFEVASANSFTLITAIRALEVSAHLKAGEKVLIHAASGGVGQAAVQLAKWAGAEVFGTASPAKQEFVKSNGVDHIMNSRTLDFAEQIMKMTDGEGVDVVLNSLNGDFIPKSLSVLKPGGRFVEIGAIGIWTEDQVRATRPDIIYEHFDMLNEEIAEPGMMGRMLSDAMGRLERGEVKPIPHRAFSGAEVVDSFRHMAQAKHIGKVMVSFGPQSETAPAAKHVIAEATYLITGGLGALGLEAAKLLVRQGARHLVLTGRTGAATKSAQHTVSELTSSGVEVLVSKTDVADAAQVESLLKEIHAGMPPLKGVVHAAGVLADGLLVEQEWEQFRKVLAPKAAGAWNLHQATRDQDLNFMISFSSIASLLGSAAQGNYAAANAFLDALAHRRHHGGLAGLSINWGPWADVGMAAELSRKAKARWAGAGIGMIAIERGMDLFGELLNSSGQIGVVPVDWNRLLSNLADVPFLRMMREELGVSGKSAFLEELNAAPPEKRRQILHDHITGEIAAVLGMKPDEIAMDVGFFEMGLDSLTAVELRNRLQVSLRTVLAPTLIFNYPTLGAMITHFADDVLELPKADEAEDDNELADLDVAEAEVLASVPADELSEDDVAKMLREKIAMLRGDEGPEKP